MLNSCMPTLGLIPVVAVAVAMIVNYYQGEYNDCISIKMLKFNGCLMLSLVSLTRHAHARKEVWSNLSHGGVKFLVCCHTISAFIFPLIKFSIINTSIFC